MTKNRPEKTSKNDAKREPKKLRKPLKKQIIFRPIFSSNFGPKTLESADLVTKWAPEDAKWAPEDALGEPGAAKSAQGPMRPGKGQGAKILGVPFGTPNCLHFCFHNSTFFHQKNNGFQAPNFDQKWSPKRSKIDSENTSKILLDCWSHFGFENAPKSIQKWSKQASKIRMFFVCALVTLFPHFFKGFLMVVPGARPSFWLLFTLLSWGAAFFVKSENL